MTENHDARDVDLLDKFILDLPGAENVVRSNTHLRQTLNEFP